MLAAAELPEEFTGPVGYDSRWWWLVAGLIALVLAYYLASWWLTRAPRPPAPAPTAAPDSDARALHLGRIDAIADAVATGRIPAREGHQQLSETVRSWAETVTSLPARSMALADFRDRAPASLVEALELMYPPEFAPEGDLADAAFAEALTRGRAFVEVWG